MTDQATRVVPAGWYEDPSNSTQVRWWNGIAWTDHTQDKPDTAGDASEASVTGPISSRVANRIRSTSTAESWIVSFSPILLAVALLTAGWAWLYVAPTIVFIVAALVLNYVVVVLFALLDRRKLTAWKHTPPAAIGAFLTAPVYLLLRGRRLARSWGQLVGWALLMLVLIGLPVGAWYGGALHSVQTAVQIQTEIRDELVSSGQASNVSCPPIADTTTVGSIYTCSARLSDGTERGIWVSIDSDAGDYSYSFAVK